MDWPASAFWDYSLWLCGQPGVEGACLELQERHALDVNLLLWCCWLASRGIALDAATGGWAVRASDAWQTDVIRPLRAARQRLRNALADSKAAGVAATSRELVAALRQQVSAVELHGEHLEQLHLERLATGLPAEARPGIALASRNLRHLFAFGEADRPALCTLLGRAFPDETAAERDAALAQLMS